MKGNGGNNDERRKFARLDVALSVGYSVKQSTGHLSEEADAMSSDISSGGLRLMTPTELKVGDILSLKIQLSDDDKSLDAEGEVVWQRKLSDKTFETGVVIKSMNQLDKEKFMHFIYDQMLRLVGSS